MIVIWLKISENDFIFASQFSFPVEELLKSWQHRHFFGALTWKTWFLTFSQKLLSARASLRHYFSCILPSLKNCSFLWLVYPTFPYYSFSDIIWLCVPDHSTRLGQNIHTTTYRDSWNAKIDTLAPNVDLKKKKKKINIWPCAMITQQLQCVK